MKILHLSDLHGQHETLKLPDLSDIDVICNTGDATNKKDSIFNEKEFFDFLEWYSSIDHKNKIYVAGNHDSWIFYNEKRAKSLFEKHGITYLNKESTTIDGVKFWGDPTTHVFNDWYFMAKKEKMHKHWELIPSDTNVLLTHTPPKGILDLGTDIIGNFEFCGCESLYKRIKDLKNLKANLFGHIHNSKKVRNNFGVYIDKYGVKFSNAASVVDGKFGEGVDNHGNVIEIQN